MEDGLNTDEGSVQGSSGAEARRCGQECARAGGRLFGAVEEGELDGLAPEFEEGLLPGLVAGYGHAGMTAEGAELHQLAAAPPQPVHAGVTEHFAAMGALVGRAGLGVAGTDEGAVGQDDGRGRARLVKDGNGDGDLGGLDQQFDFSEAEGLAGGEPGFLDSVAVDERAVGGSAVVDEEAVVGEHDFAVRGGDGGVVDLEIIGVAASKAVDAQVKFKHPVSPIGGFDDQSRHVYGCKSGGGYGPANGLSIRMCGRQKWLPWA
jgi:hypothetical protein